MRLHLLNEASHLTLRSLLLCSISVTDGGPVVSGPGAISVQPGGEVQQSNPVLTGEVVADPAAPVVELTAEEKAAEEVRRDALTQEQRDAEDAAKNTVKKPADEETPATDWAARDKSKDVPLDDAQKAQIAGMAHLNDAQKVAITDFTLEMNTTGDLSPASKEAAAKLWNVDAAMVDNYVAGIKSANARAKNVPPAGEVSAADVAAIQTRLDALHKEYGGKETWEQFGAWATGGGLSEAQQLELATAIGVSPSLGVMAAKQYVDLWKAQGNGGGPRDLSRGGALESQQPLQSAVKGFASQAEQQEALNARDSMGRSKMDTDTAYRQSVEQKMAVSDFSKTGLEASFNAGARGPMM